MATTLAICALQIATLIPCDLECGVSGVVRALTPEPKISGIEGYAVYANKAWRDIVLDNRARWGQNLRCDYCTGYAAVADCSRLGQDIWLSFDGVIEGPLRVHDCASKQHRATFERLHRVVEVDGYIADEHDMRGPVWVTVYDENPCGKYDAAGQPLLCAP